jgi:RimJ/RimL family protein N-acetyltransferase
MNSFANKPTIVGERMVLRPLVASDAESMWLDLHDDEANRLTGTHGGITRDQVDDWCATRQGEDDRLDLAAVDGTTGEWLGEVVINEWDPDNSSCSFRIALSASARGRGLGIEATLLIVDYVFNELPVNRLELEVFAFNPRAMAVYKRVGFRTEGCRRQALHWDGEFVDAIMMSIVRSDRG